MQSSMKCEKMEGEIQDSVLNNKDSQEVCSALVD